MCDRREVSRGRSGVREEGSTEVVVLPGNTVVAWNSHDTQTASYLPTERNNYAN